MKTAPVAILNLTALWALSESGLGGLLHGFKIPITGLVLGGFAVMIISQIARLTEKPFGAILQATLTVILVKALVSPHSPPPAYLAVAFQGLMGALCYKFLPNYILATYIFSSIALLESAAQKFLIMTLLFGKEVWTAADALFQDICKNWGITQDISISAWIIGIYCGFFVLWGWIIAGIIHYDFTRSDQYIKIWKQILNEAVPASDKALPNKKKGSSMPKWGIAFLIIAVISSLIFLQTSGKNIQTALYIFIRSIGIFLVFTLLITPYLRKWLQKKATKQRASGKLDAMYQSMDRQRTHAALIIPWCKKNYTGLTRWIMTARLLLTAAIDETEH